MVDASRPQEYQHIVEKLKAIQSTVEEALKGIHEARLNLSLALILVLETASEEISTQMKTALEGAFDAPDMQEHAVGFQGIAFDGEIDRFREIVSTQSRSCA